MVRLGQLRLSETPSRLSIEGRRSRGLIVSATLFLVALGGLIIPFGTRHGTSLGMRIFIAWAVWTFAIVFAIINNRMERVVLDASSNRLEYTPQHRRKPITRTLLEISRINIESDERPIFPHYRLVLDHPHGRIDTFFGQNKHDLDKLEVKITSFVAGARRAV